MVNLLIHFMQTVISFHMQSFVNYGRSRSCVAKVADVKKDNGAEKANITFKISSTEQGFDVFVVAREHLTAVKQE